MVKMTVPDHLQINGRTTDQNFHDDDILYRGFGLHEYDHLEETIKLESIRFPDLSCNWERYSEVEDIKFRQNGKNTDGCYSFSVVVSRYENIATPVHDPIDDPEYPNYAHTEIRVLRANDPQGYLPPKGRKLPKSKVKKMRYRQNMANLLTIEVLAKDS